MSAMSAAHVVRDPSGLFEPDFEDERITKIAEYLTTEGSQAFFRQIYEAIARSRTERDLRYLNDVLESWYRTLLFVSTPGHIERARQARENPGPRLTVEDIRKRREALT